MLIAEADFPFLDVLWTIIVFFAWVAWIWIVDHVLHRPLPPPRHRRLGQGRLGRVRDRDPVPRRARLSDRPARRDARAQRRAGQEPAGRRSTSTCARPPAARRARSPRPRSCSTPARSPRRSSTRSRPRRWPESRGGKRCCGGSPTCRRDDRLRGDRRGRGRRLGGGRRAGAATRDRRAARSVCCTCSAPRPARSRATR